MKQQASSGFNKEKLIFLATAGLLAICVYHYFASRPIALEVGIPVSPLPIPAPLAPEKPDTRKANVVYYLQTGMYDGVAINRERNDPFAPIYDLKDAAPIAVDTKNVKPNAAVIPMIEPPPPPEVAKTPSGREEEHFDKDPKAAVDFSAVMAMNGVVYAQLKNKDGKMFRVQVGDYMEDFKYTVTKIEKQAIWVVDDKDRTFVARDLSFIGEGSGDAKGGDEKAPKKKDKPGKGGGGGGPDVKPAAGAAPAADKKGDPSAEALADAAKQLKQIMQAMNDAKANGIIRGDQGRQPRNGR